MHKLISEFIRLYLPAGTVDEEALADHVRGQANIPFPPGDSDGRLRAIVIPFEKSGDSGDAGHWSRLCTVANALQVELGFPSPAVSITGAGGYRLWLSLETPVPGASAQEFLALLRQAYFPEVELPADAARQPLELPPCLNQGTGKWAAFIHPGLGASFAEDGGLEMAPPIAGQVAFLEALQSISATQFDNVLEMLRTSHGIAPAAIAAQPATSDSLLLKDATLEDIVRHLHSRNIEPTFRHIIP